MIIKETSTKRSAYTVLEPMVTIAVISLMFMLFNYNSSFIEEMSFENACCKIMTDGICRTWLLQKGDAVPFLSNDDEKNFKNVELVGVLVYYQNGNKNSAVEKAEFNKYGGLKLFEEGAQKNMTMKTIAMRTGTIWK